jgi:hypothetical protein
MGILVVSEMVVKEGKNEEFIAVTKKFMDYYERNSEKWEKMKSIKFYSRTLGGTYGAYVELNEYDSLSDYEDIWEIALNDQEWMSLYEEFMVLIENGSVTSKVLNFVM